MPSPYRAVFAAPGSRWFSVAGFLGRLPIPMTGVGIVTMISERTGRYQLAGALAAVFALSMAVFSPQLARLVDRYGQRRVLRPALAVTATALTGLVLGVRSGAPEWVLFGCAVAAGCTPSMGSMVRARWAALYHGERRMLHSAFALETIVDETCFVIGPILAIGLSTAWFPEAGPMLAGCLLVTGVLWLTAQRATEPVPQPREPGTSGGSALRMPGLQVLAAAFVFTGAIFGSIDVVTVAYAEDTGHKAAASVVLACYALGSVLAGAAFGLVQFSGPAARRWVWGIGAMAVSMIPLQLVGGLTSLAVALFVAGMTIAPTMVTTVGLVEQLVPRSRLTEGMTWTSTGLAVGVAGGSAVAGWAVDAFGADQAYVVPAGAGLLAACVALLGHRRLTAERPHKAAPAQGGVVDERVDEKQADEKQLGDGPRHRHGGPPTGREPCEVDPRAVREPDPDGRTDVA